MTVLFPIADALTQFRADQLPLLQANFALPVAPSDGLLTRKFEAAEGELQRELGVYLAPTMIFGGVDPTDEQIAALNGAPYAIESGYDMTPDFFSVGQWGTLMLRSRPVKSITSMKFIYPTLNAQVIDMPTSWIQLDKRMGLVNVVPGPGGLNIPLNIFAMQAMNTGTTVPNMIRVQYTAGLDPTHFMYADVQDVCMRLVGLRLIKDTFTPQSGSISADGLSQSQSVDLAKFADGIKDDIAAMRSKLLGPVIGVF
jgi:hypothetical protein